MTKPESRPRLSSLPPDSAGAGEAAGRILAAAEALFAERGFDGVSMNEIAARADVSKANVFHHFSSKNALYLEVVRLACRDSAEQLDHLESDQRPFPERLADFAREHLASLLAQERVSRLVLRELLENGPRRGQELAERVFGEKFARFVAILRAAQAQGALRTDVDPAMIATLLIGADVFLFEARDVLRHFPQVDFAEDPARYSAMLTDILLHGIVRLSVPPKPPTRSDRAAAE
jgi:TetR/AcrR family transcriptional regulator